jgi:thioredoxin 2
MPDALHVVCPHCDTINRVPGAKLRAGGKCGSCHGALFTEHPLALDDARFARHAERSDLPLLVDFWAAWCAPCRDMAPVFEAAAQQLEPGVRLAKVDVDAEPGLAARFRVSSIPTLVLLHKGRELGRAAGAMQLPRLLSWVRQHTAAAA